MPALQQAAHPAHLTVVRDLSLLEYDLFCELFEKTIHEWCATGGLRYAGEKTSVRLSQLRYMDIPGCGPGHRRAGDGLDLLNGGIRGNARATASAAYSYGKEGSLCECFHSLVLGRNVAQHQAVERSAVADRHAASSIPHMR